MGQEIDDIIRIVETWDHQKKAVFQRQPFGGGSNARSLREFVEIENRLTRRLLTLIGRQGDQAASFWESLGELAMNAARVASGAKVLVDKQDASQEGM